ncbi:phospholipase D [Auriscalpium vulgare]|uniref:Phospholipase D n=1 Tax=Auriscalpium vulgare TaxID=40419 RepID=A0ACB8RGQ1_9AGAM|nr:phospholipase D [Auriscalpium vulgare]
MAFIAKLAKRLPEGIQRTEDTLIGASRLLNPNRRHDDPEEIHHDEIRAEINASHRYDSFAEERSQNFVKWHIDGHDYFYALSEMLESARECIFILDWWLTPELYLRRPPAHHPEWRLDRILKRKAEQGVRIYVIVYKEVTQTMSMSSSHTKKALEALHPNIACMRHPDHIGSKDNVEFWSHHEKVVVVDNHRACIGGLDICFGRWDTNNHPLADAHPTDFSRTLFPGQDYNNARITDFQDVYNYVSGTISVLDSPRMPWHDVHMTLAGPVALDIVQHFTERWNEIKKRKYRNDVRYDVLALPHDVNAAPNEAVVRHPHRERWHQIGRHFRQRFHIEREEDYGDDPETYKRPPHGTCRVQVVRSVSDWSHGVLTEHSIQNAYIQLIKDAEHHIYIENQFFISNTKKDGPVKNQIAAALVERIVRAARDGRKFKVVVVIPELPAFAGDVKSETSLKTIMAAQYRTINRGGSSIYEEIRKAGFEPLDYIRFYHLRVYDRINAPLNSLIAKMEERSGVKFNQAQVALARMWVGDSADAGQPNEVTIKLSQPTAEGIVVSGKTEVKTEKYPMPASYDEAKDIIERFERAADVGRRNDDVSDTVVQHSLRDNTRLIDEKWLGDEQEELDSYVSELSYIHTKLMIVDDRRVIMGSANLNDRSQKGDGDSEIALVVEDQDFIESTMDGQPYMAARFAATLRRKLFRQHLGLIPPQTVQDRNEPVTTFMRPATIPNEDETHYRDDALVADPLSDRFLNLFSDTARRNREIFTELFRPVPTNLVRDWNAYANYVPKVKTGHVVPDIPLARVKERLAEVHGSLVEAPLDFLIDENDFVEGPDWKGLNPTLPIYI